MASIHTARVVDQTAQIISQALVTADMPRVRLAELTGIPNTTLRRKLAGQTPFDIADVFVIADALGVRASALLPDELHSPAAGSA